MEQLGYGVIGLGFFGEKHAEVAAALPQMKLVAVCGRQQERREEIKQKCGARKAYEDYRELLADEEVQAVSVVTHVEDHLEPTLAALAAEKHVLLEKPMANNVADCDRMIAAARQAKRTLMVGHICRFNPRYAIARERIAAGELGEIASMYARRNIPAQRSETVLNKIGPLLGDAIHDIDLMLWMSGAKVQSVHAMTHAVRGLRYPDIGWAMLRFDNGTIGVTETVWMLPDGTPFRIHEQMEMIGTRGSLYIHGGDMNLVVQTAQQIDCPDTLYWPTIHGRPQGALAVEMAYFADCVLAGKTPEVVTPADARAAVQVAVAAEESARTGQTVMLR